MNRSRTLIQASILSLLVLSTGLELISCAGTDVLGQAATTSFEALVKKLETQVSYNRIDQAWELDSPAGDALKFSLDFSRPNVRDDTPDLEMEFSAAPFLKAGLDLSKLPSDKNLHYRLEDGKFMLQAEWSDQALEPLKGGDGKPLAVPGSDAAPALGMVNTFQRILADFRDRIGYHEKLGHYNIALGGGNQVEWAKDMAANDTDLIFVLEPAPLIAAGLNPAKVAGWTFAKVETADSNGKVQLVDKLLKAFNL